MTFLGMTFLGINFLVALYSHSFKKNFMGLKFCMELDISTADENLIK
jgi:hypothetical protein